MSRAFHIGSLTCWWQRDAVLGNRLQLTQAPASQRVINRVLKLMQTQRPEAATHWSTREIARRVGISHTKVHQILRAHDLKPHLVERWFAEISTRRIRRGSFSSVKELERAIMDCIHHWNESGRRFVWTNKPQQILRNMRKAAAQD